jgi:hypothetical protein
MNLRNRLGIAVTTVAIGVVSLLGMSACSPGTAAAAVMSPEQSALSALGFSDGDVAPAAMNSTAGPSGTSSKGTHPGLRRLRLRRELRKHIEHGQITVETKKGDQTIDVQRGTVTAATSTTLTVKSNDGFTLTWTIGSPISVFDHGTKSDVSAVKTGAIVGVAGTQSGSITTARLIVIPKRQTES